VRVIGALERDPDFKTDRLLPQFWNFFGAIELYLRHTDRLLPTNAFSWTSGRVEIEIPWNAQMTGRANLHRDVLGGAPKVEEFPVVDQYTIQGDEFSRAVPASVRFRAARRCHQEHGVIEAIFNARIRANGRGGEDLIPQIMRARRQQLRGSGGCDN